MNKNSFTDYLGCDISAWYLVSNLVSYLVPYSYNHPFITVLAVVQNGGILAPGCCPLMPG